MYHHMIQNPCTLYQYVIQSWPVIKSFKNDLARTAFEGEATKGFPADLLKVARRKLQYLNAAIFPARPSFPSRQSAGSLEG